VASTGKLILAVVRARGILFIGVAGSCLAASAGYGLLAADHYRAVATLFIDPSPFDARALNGGPSAARGSELDLLRSERVAQRVAENERLVEEPALRALYLESIDAGRPPLETMAQYVADRVDATGSDDGGMVRLSVTLGDAALAARVANAYAQAWGEVSLELRANAIRSGVERAHEDLVSLRARLGQARARLSDGTALAAAGSRADEQFAELSRLSTRPIAPAPAALLDAVPNAAAGAIHNIATALPVGAVDTARFDGAAADSALGGVAAGERWDGARRDEHDSARRRTAGAAAGAASSADDEIRLAQQSLERAEDRLARLAAEGIGAPFPAHMLRPARMPDTSTKPGLAVCAALGLAAGLVLGVLAMLLGEILDRRVRRPADLSRLTGIVVLGNLPAVAPAATSGRRGSALRLQRAGGAAF
jgi:uncharacterized protein involved in exopolysaccharide biosynthesis